MVKPVDIGYALLAALPILGMLGLIGLLFFAPLPDGPARDLLLVIAGALVSLTKEVYGYWFGSSAGSSEKTEILRDRMK